MQREEGRTARLYTLTLTSILACWSPYYLASIVRYKIVITMPKNIIYLKLPTLRLFPMAPPLPPWSLYLVMSPCFLYPLISPFIFACRNPKVRKELRRVFQVKSRHFLFKSFPPNFKHTLPPIFDAKFELLKDFCAKS